jgi:hypothetical protein
MFVQMFQTKMQNKIFSLKLKIKKVAKSAKIIFYKKKNVESETR